jgi:cell division protein FtsQ
VARGPVFTKGGRRDRALKGELLVDDKTRRKIARRRLRRLIIFSWFVLVLAGLSAAYFSPLFRVNEVEVTGTTAINAEDIEATASLDGESMLTVDFTEAERAIEEMPQVKDATFERRWPQGVRIAVTERAPWGMWQIASTQYVIDDEGVVLAGVTPPAGLPVIQATASAGSLQLGDRVDRDAIALARALTEQVPARLTQNIASIEWTNASGLTVVTDTGARVVVGDSENLDYKLTVWSQIEAEMGREAIAGHVLDLRFGDRPSLH